MVIPKLLYNYLCPKCSQIVDEEDYDSFLYEHNIKYRKMMCCDCLQTYTFKSNSHNGKIGIEKEEEYEQIRCICGSADSYSRWDKCCPICGTKMVINYNKRKKLDSYLLDLDGKKYYIKTDKHEIYDVLFYGEIIHGLRPFSIINGDKKLYGCLDMNNSVVIDCKYKMLKIDEYGHIIVIPSFFIGTRNTYSSVSEYEIDLEEHPIIRIFDEVNHLLVAKSLDCDAIKYYFSSYYIFIKNEKFGVLSNDGTIIVEAVYNQIKCIEYNEIWFLDKDDNIIIIYPLTYGEGFLYAEERINKSYDRAKYFINTKGEKQFELNQMWLERYWLSGNLNHIKVYNGFKNGIARIDINDDGYYRTFVKINKNFELVDDFEQVEQYSKEYDYEPDYSDLVDDPSYFDNLSYDERLYREAFDNDPMAEWNID